MSSHDLVVETIRQEHHALGWVVEVLQKLLDEIAAEYTEPDYTLLGAALYYIDDFSERVHHPKEDEHLFTALRANTSDFDATLDELQREHSRSAQMVAKMQRTFIHYLAGAYGALQAFKSAVDEYAGLMQEHTRKEEDLLASARDRMPDSEWQRIAEAFSAQQDPLNAQNIRAEFRKLHRRIRDSLPHKLRYPQRAD